MDSINSHRLLIRVRHFNLFAVKSALSGSFCQSYRSCSPLHFLHDWQKYLGSTPISRQSEFIEPTLIKMKYQRRYIVIPIFLLTLFVAYQASIMHFSHIHYINGVMIVHSHPSTNNQHTHTEGQALTLAHISHWSGIEPTIFALDEVIFEVFDVLECKREFRFLTDRHAYCICLRAPPFC